jgi:DNA primase large subunit
VSSTAAILIDISHSCQQILQPGAAEYGCPYRHYSPENLQTALMSSYSSHGLTSADLQEIMGFVKNQHYHVACTRVFEITHTRLGVKKGDGLDRESVTHPNQYVAHSMGLAKTHKETSEAMVVG